MKLHKNKIGIIRMGYVGLPLAAAFAKKQKVIGFDINKKRINDLINGLDITNEINKKNLKNIKNLKFSNFLSLKKSKIIKTIKIINIYAVGVCIDKKAKKQV